MSDNRTDAPPAGIPEDAPPPIQLPARIPLTADDRGIIAVIPRNTEEAARYAKAVIAAGIVPDAYTHQKDVFEHGTGNTLIRKGEPNEPLILMGILKSLEVGLAPITGLGTIFPVNNRFAIYGDGAVALIQRDRVITDHVEHRIGPAFDPSWELADWPDDYGWEVRYWRKLQDQPYIGRFTVKDARRATLWLSRRDPWLKFPDRMLYNRARAFALRDGFADCLSGLGIVEELRDIIPVDGGDLRPTGKPSYLDDEPVTEEPRGIEHRIEPQGDLERNDVKETVERDLGGADDQGRDF